MLSPQKTVTHTNLHIIKLFSTRDILFHPRCLSFHAMFHLQVVSFYAIIQNDSRWNMKLMWYGRHFCQKKTRGRKIISFTWRKLTISSCFASFFSSFLCSRNHRVIFPGSTTMRYGKKIGSRINWNRKTQSHQSYIFKLYKGASRIVYFPFVLLTCSISPANYQVSAEIASKIKLSRTIEGSVILK